MHREHPFLSFVAALSIAMIASCSSVDPAPAGIGLIAEHPPAHGEAACALGANEVP